MSLPTIDPTTTNSWAALETHFQEIKGQQMQDVFTSDSERANRFKTEWQDFYLDYSKNRITDETLSLLKKLAEEVKLKEAIELQFSGKHINETEDRAVLHTALRDFSNMKSEVKETLQKMKVFSEELISGSWKGYTGKPISDVVNIGIGGSDLGLVMTTEALKPYWHPNIKVHYVSNVDGSHIKSTLEDLSPETTLFIIASKTFTTQETMTNARSARDWFLKKAKKKECVKPL